MQVSVCKNREGGLQNVSCNSPKSTSTQIKRLPGVGPHPNREGDLKNVSLVLP